MAPCGSGSRSSIGQPTGVERRLDCRGRGLELPPEGGSRRQCNMVLLEKESTVKRDLEVLRMMRERAKGRTQEQAAARAGMSVRTARTYERLGQLPSQLKQPRRYRTRPDPFAADWAWVVSQLERDDALQATTLVCCARDAAPWSIPGWPGPDTAGAHRHLASSARSHAGSDVSADPSTRCGRTVGLHAYGIAGCDAGRCAVPAPGVPPGAQLLQR